MQTLHLTQFQMYCYFLSAFRPNNEPKKAYKILLNGENRLRDPLCWTLLIAGKSSRNLDITFFLLECIRVSNKSKSRTSEAIKQTAKLWTSGNDFPNPLHMPLSISHITQLFGMTLTFQWQWQGAEVTHNCHAYCSNAALVGIKLLDRHDVFNLIPDPVTHSDVQGARPDACGPVARTGGLPQQRTHEPPDRSNHSQLIFGNVCPLAGYWWR